MSRKDPPEVVELFQRIADLLPRAITFHGTMVRSVGTQHANEEDFLTGNGAAKHGGRWNRRGIRAIYGSLDIITATHEAYQNFLYYGFPLSAIRPRVMAGASVKLSVILDLTDVADRRRIAFTLRDLMEEDWQSIQAGGEESWTQAIGRGCRAAGFEALLVPSAEILEVPTSSSFRISSEETVRLSRSQPRIYLPILQLGQTRLHFCRFLCLPKCRFADRIDED